MSRPKFMMPDEEVSLITIKDEIVILQEQNKWLLHELKDVANRLTALGETTLSARDCIKNIKEQEK